MGYKRSGLNTLRRAVKVLGNRAIDHRTSVGKALAQWKADLLRDLGGDVSTQQLAIVDLAVKSKLLLDSIDAWLLVQPSLVNARKKALLPALVQRQQLAEGLAKHLERLGLERKAKPLPSLAEYLAAKAAEASPPAP